MDSLVAQVLAIDSQHRVVGQDDLDLFAFEDLKVDEWDYSYATLVSGNHDHKLIESTEVFKREFKNTRFSCVDMTNLLVAGGAPGNILRNESLQNDVDYFVYGIPLEQATPRVEKLLIDLTASYVVSLKREWNNAQKQARENARAQWKRQGKEEKDFVEKDEEKFTPKFDVKYIRNKHAVTAIYDSKYIAQVILRLYKSKSEILHGFDLGSSAVGWDGERLYFTTLSKFAYEYSCNIVDTTRRSTTYEKRLAKYFGRGFDIIIPQLDVTRLRISNFKHNINEVCDLPYMSFSYCDLTDNKIKIGSFLGKINNPDNDYQLDDLDEHRVFYINLHSVSQGKQDYYFIEEYHDGKIGLGILNSRPVMSRRRVIDYYDTLKKRVSGGKPVDLRLVKRYVKDLKELGKLLMEDGVDFDRVVNDLLEKEKQRVLKLLTKLTDPKATFPLSWKTDNPGTQLTSSFNPIMENPEKWYGEYFLRS